MISEAAIRTVILNNTELKSWAFAGRDGDIARDVRLATNETHPYYLTSSKIMDLLGPLRGIEILSALRAHANAGLREVALRFDNEGINMAHATAADVLTSMVTAGIITNGEKNGALGLAVKPVQPPVDLVSSALKQYRPTGQCGKNSSPELHP